jgi:hypothetical protein
MLPIILWVALRINAVGVISTVTNAPIQKLSLTSRLMNVPEIILFYISKFAFPYRLASGYYWVHPTYSFRYFLIPLCIDLVVFASIVFVGAQIHKKTNKAQYYTYLFFGVWASLGLLLCSQIVASDMTISEAWFYFPMVGILGMAGIALQTFSFRIPPQLVLVITLVALSTLGLRTILRGFDWSNPYVLASHNIMASPGDYAAYNVLADKAIDQDNYMLAERYADRSVNVYPTYSNNNELGIILVNLRDYSGAFTAYTKALHYEQGDKSPTYVQLTLLTLVQGNPNTDQQLLLIASNNYPQDSYIWLCRALFDDMHGNNAGAKLAIAKAAQYGQIPQSFYDSIMNNQSFAFNVLGKNIEI